MFIRRRANEPSLCMPSRFSSRICMKSASPPTRANYIYFPTKPEIQIIKWKLKRKYTHKQTRLVKWNWLSKKCWSRQTFPGVGLTCQPFRRDSPLKSAFRYGQFTAQIWINKDTGRTAVTRDHWNISFILSKVSLLFSTEQ